MRQSLSRVSRELHSDTRISSVVGMSACVRVGDGSSSNDPDCSRASLELFGSRLEKVAPFPPAASVRC